MQLNWFDHLFFFLIGIVFPVMSVLSEKAGKEEIEESRLFLPPKKHIYYSNGLMLFIGALIVLTLWNLSERDFEKLGFSTVKMSTEVVWLVAGIALIYISDTVYNVIKSLKNPEQWKDLTHIMPSSWEDYRHFVFLALAAGTCEEIVFRGFMMNYVAEIAAGTGYAELIALILPAAIFAVSHIYQGWASVVKIASISLLFGSLYIFTSSLFLVMIIHTLVDLISGAVLVFVSQRK